jgi:hypothetical protein
MFSNVLFSISKEWILKRVSEEDIFKRYLGIEPSLKGQFRNTLRTDKNADCSFYINSLGRWKFKDFAGGFNWDCFNVVEYKENLSFKEALVRIAIDFGLIHGKEADAFLLATTERKQKEKVQIRVKKRSWTKEDIKFWRERYISESQLARFNIYPISHAWFVKANILVPAYYFTSNDPCYCYDFGNYEYKLYFPKRTSGKKFLQSASNYIQGFEQLPQFGNNLLYTKSMKDVVAIDNFSNIFDLYSVAPLSETVVISTEMFSDLYNRFDNQATLFDFDRTGIRLARKYESLYKLPFFFFGKSFRGSIFKCQTGIKDFSDFLMYNGLDKTKSLIEKFIKLNNDIQEDVF